MAERTWVTVTQAALRTGYTPRAIYYAIRHGQAKATRRGGRQLVHLPTLVNRHRRIEVVDGLRWARIPFAAELIGRVPSAVHVRLRSGQIRRKRMMNAWYVCLDDLERWRRKPAERRGQ